MKKIAYVKSTSAGNKKAETKCRLSMWKHKNITVHMLQKEKIKSSMSQEIKSCRSKGTV